MENKILTSPNNYDTILTDDRQAIFLSVNLAQSRFGKLNRLPIINRNAPFYLEGIMTKKESQKKWKDTHKEYILAYNKQYNNTHKKEMLEYQRIYFKNNPWLKHYKRAQSRCLYPCDIKYKNYGARGIKFLMTMQDFKDLWFRDKAWLLKLPSIDRLNNDGDYTLENCRFIEVGENARRANLKTQRIKEI